MPSFLWSQSALRAEHHIPEFQYIRRINRNDMLSEQIELMMEQLPKVREAVEVLKEVIETDVRSVPDFDSSVLPDMFDAIEADINILNVALPLDRQDDYAGYEDEVDEGRTLVSRAESLLSTARKKYSL